MKRFCNIWMKMTYFDIINQSRRHSWLRYFDQFFPRLFSPLKMSSSLLCFNSNSGSNLSFYSWRNSLLSLFLQPICYESFSKYSIFFRTNSLILLYLLLTYCHSISIISQISVQNLSLRPYVTARKLGFLLASNIQSLKSSSMMKSTPKNSPTLLSYKSISLTLRKRCVTFLYI